MKVDGRCHCGFISYVAEVDPENIHLCHCADCQILSGTAFRTVASAQPGSFKLLSGEPKTYVKTAESGNRRVQAFCPNCGTPLYSADAENPRSFNLRVGALAERDQLPPQRQIWCEAALPWTADLLDVPRTSKQ